MLALAVATDVRREFLFGTDLIAPFSAVPASDNGLHVGALAAIGEHLWFGLRGPVLNGAALVLRTGPKARMPVALFSGRALLAPNP